jgi:beta-phosphoglucomutase
MRMDTTQNGQWGVIFDMDGVLIDSYDAHRRSWDRVLPQRGLEMTDEMFATTFGQRGVDVMPRLFPFLSRQEISLIHEEKALAVREIIADDFPERDGASELITALYLAGAVIAIGSSAPRENVEVLMEKMPASQYVTATTSGSELTHGKPDPEVFLKTINKIGLPPEKCIVVEDAPAGVTAAKAAGCSVIGVTGTVSREQLEEAGLVVDSLRELTPEKCKEIIGDASYAADLKRE